MSGFMDGAIMKVLAFITVGCVFMIFSLLQGYGIPQLKGAESPWQQAGQSGEMDFKLKDWESGCKWQQLDFKLKDWESGWKWQ